MFPELGGSPNRRKALAIDHIEPLFHLRRPARSTGEQRPLTRIEDHANGAADNPAFTGELRGLSRGAAADGVIAFRPENQRS